MTQVTPTATPPAGTAAAAARLLLVDDDESVLLTMQAILEAAGHRVIAAGTLREALEAVERSRTSAETADAAAAAGDASAPDEADEIDVVVSDLHLDEGDGLQVIAAARQKDPTTTGIILTGYGSFEAITRAVRAGVDDFLVKPTDVDELKRSIARCATKAREARALAARAREAEAARRAEAALRESEARFRLVANVAPVMIWAAAPDGRCTFLNRRWLEFTGRSLEQELGYGWFDGIHPDDRADFERTYTRAYADQAPFSMEYRLRSADGSYRWVQDDGAPYTTLDGAFGGYVGACVDVTEHKREVLEREALLRRERAARREAEAEAELARAEAEAVVLKGRAAAAGGPSTASPPLPPSGLTAAPPARPAPPKPPTSAVGLVRNRPRSRPEPPKPPSSVPTGEG